MLFTALLSFLASAIVYAVGAPDAGFVLARIGEIAVIVFAVAAIVALVFPKTGQWRIGEHAHAHA